MSDAPDDDTNTQKATLAAAFGRDTDPLAEHATTFEQTDVDPFALFETDVLDPRDIVDNTRYQYDIVFRQWREHMAREARHPACPNEGHVKRFAQHELTKKENHPSTVKEKLRKLNEVYEYWVAEPGFPHPQDYNPVTLARSKTNFDAPDTKEPPRIPVEKLRGVIEDVPHLRGRAIIVLQLKLGLRASELGNLKLSEVSIQNQLVHDHYSELGMHPMLDDRENAIYIPHDREDNKSQRPRVLPLDDEARRVLLRYLLMRPDNGEPWVFLSHSHHEKLGNQGILSVWKDAFHPEYNETERHRAVTSHFGRHYFTSFWTVEQEANRELVKYMRGDTTGGAVLDGPPGAIDTYIHTYYENIEPMYREHIFRLGI